jgi:hypothetical protein
MIPRLLALPKIFFFSALCLLRYVHDISSLYVGRSIVNSFLLYNMNFSAKVASLKSEGDVVWLWNGTRLQQMKQDDPSHDDFCFTYHLFHRQLQSRAKAPTDGFSPAITTICTPSLSMSIYMNTPAGSTSFILPSTPTPAEEINSFTTDTYPLWFPDGTVILRTTDESFRVFGGLLACHCAVFKDMLSVPQPAGDVEEMVEGCPVIDISDSADDLKHFLRAIHYHGYEVL